MSRVSHSVLSIPDAGDTVWNHVMSCTHLPAGGAGECLTCGRNWINVAMRVLSAACDCCNSLWSKNCSFSVNFEIAISLQSLFPIMFVSLTNMASSVFWMPELTSPHHHYKQIRRQHLGTRRSVPSCPVACHWILTCGHPSHTHTPTTSAPSLHGPLFPRWFGNALLERRGTPCHQYPWLLTN